VILLKAMNETKMAVAEKKPPERKIVPENKAEHPTG
jgi:hypothetical protein